MLASMSKVICMFFCPLIMTDSQPSNLAGRLQEQLGGHYRGRVANKQLHGGPSTYKVSLKLTGFCCPNQAFCPMQKELILATLGGVAVRRSDAI